VERLIFIFLIFFIGSINIYPDLNDYAKESVSKAIVEPAKFFFELKNDSEIILPVNSGKSYTININFLPSLVPFTYVNSSLNYCLYKEGILYNFFPQIDVVGGFAYMIGGDILANAIDDVNDLKIYGYHFGMIFSDSVKSKARIFYGFKYSYTYSKLSLNPLKKHSLIGVDIKSFDTNFIENSIIFGVELLKDLNKYFSISLSYGLTNQSIIYGVSWYGKWFMMGFNFYPEGVIQIHPYWGMRIGF